MDRIMDSLLNRIWFRNVHGHLDDLLDRIVDMLDHRIWMWDADFHWIVDRLVHWHVDVFLNWIRDRNLLDKCHRFLVMMVHIVMMIVVATVPAMAAEIVESFAIDSAFLLLLVGGRFDCLLFGLLFGFLVAHSRTDCEQNESCNDQLERKGKTEHKRSTSTPTKSIEKEVTKLDEIQ